MGRLEIFMPQAVFREQREREGSSTAPISALEFFPRLDFEACLIGCSDIADRIESIDAFVRDRERAISVFAARQSSESADLTSHISETLRQRDGVCL
jgi:hypothetical protein